MREKLDQEHKSFYRVRHHVCSWIVSKLFDQPLGILKDCDE